jgi:uncharacterized protein YecE (DUF72 family)
LKEYLIGTGGWAYFQVPQLSSLLAYSRVFDFVEVNSTFYQIPPLKEVERWRKLVPQNFKFSVRAHRSITHQHKLQPVQETYEVLDRMKHICGVLNADILHIQTPTTFTPTEPSINNLRNFLASANLGRLRIALEIRGVQPSNLPSDLVKTMQGFNVVHSVDLSKGEMPAYESDRLYTRLFGKGRHNVYQPTDGELAEIDNKASSGKSEKIAMSFHFVRMYKDAARLKIYKQTGKFPTVTRSTGVTSLEEVLSEDARFPTTKQELVQSQGWKLFDLTKTERARTGDLLQRLPEGTYKDIREVTERVKQSMR